MARPWLWLPPPTDDEREPAIDQAAAVLAMLHRGDVCTGGLADFADVWRAHHFAAGPLATAKRFGVRRRRLQQLTTPADHRRRVADFLALRDGPTRLGRPVDKGK